VGSDYKKKWAPGSYCLELVVKLVQLPGQVLSFSDASESIRKDLIPCELNNWFIHFCPTVQEIRNAYLSVHWSVELATSLYVILLIEISNQFTLMILFNTLFWSYQESFPLQVTL
jgi:hypothetical protein